MLACVNLRDEEAEHVVQGASRWAAVAGAIVDVMFVDEVVPVPVWVTDPLSAQVLTSQWDEVRAEEDRRLTQLLAAVPEASRGQPTRVEGRPAEEIVRRASSYDAVVVAGRRHSALGKALLGSVAARVARSSPTPVLVLPGRDHATDRPTGGHTTRALFGVDLRAEDAGTGLATAMQWAARFGATLDLAHIDSSRMHVPYILDPDMRKRLDEEWEALRQRDVETLAGMLAKVPLDHRGLPRVDEGDAATGLCDVAEDYDLLIVATHGRTGVARWMLGSVAERVIQSSRRPVLLVRATG